MTRNKAMIIAPMLACFLTGTALLPTSAHAESWRGGTVDVSDLLDHVQPVAQDVIRDDRGRHFLVDRRTGRVIKRLWREGDWRRSQEQRPFVDDYARAEDWRDEDAFFDEPRGDRRLDRRWDERFERRLERGIETKRERRARLRELRRQERLERAIERRLAKRPWLNDRLEEAEPEWEPRRQVAPRPNVPRETARKQSTQGNGLGVEPKVRRGTLPLLGNGSKAEQPQIVQPQDPIQQDSVDGNTQIARLPDQNEPLKTVEPIPSLAKPAYGPTRMMELQIVLDRAGFSPGVIDGRWGTNVEKALRAYKLAKGSKVDLRKPAHLANALSDSGGAALIDYTLTQEDVSGPFVPRIPIDYARKAEMKVMAYTSVVEKLAEKFHLSEAALTSLNPGKQLRAGETIKIPAVGSPVQSKVHYLVADKAQKQVRAFDRNGVLVAAYPATIGSQATPSPSGTHTITRVAFDPQYTYDPKKNFKQGSNDKVLVVPPGPNGPVGSVWIALSKESYGIHGTPRPDQIGKTNSNGCIRLTNWDAQELARLVREGVTVEFKG